MSSNRHLPLPVLFTGLLLTACESPLPPPPASFDDRFRSADANQDDRVSRDELADYMAYHLFYKRDANRDGELTVQEWWPDADVKERAGFDRRDANHNDILTLKEARLYSRSDPAIDQTIKLADKNGDGSASWKEINAYLGTH
jgi:hypothetical protein